jgi:hypothetical protein
MIYAAPWPVSNDVLRHDSFCYIGIVQLIRHDTRPQEHHVVSLAAYSCAMFTKTEPSITDFPPTPFQDPQLPLDMQSLDLQVHMRTSRNTREALIWLGYHCTHSTHSTHSKREKESIYFQC